jgi:LPS-assembly lipoprotein
MNGRIATTFLVMTLTLSGCGFQLRQPANLPAAMQRTYIASGESNNQMIDVQLVRELTRNLTTPTTAITKDAAKATAIFYVLKSRRYERVLSVSNTGQPLVNQVAYVVDFSVTTKSGRTLVAPQELILTRQYNYNTGNVVGDTEQSKVLYQAMVRDMVQLILFRLEALNRKTANQSPPQ